MIRPAQSTCLITELSAAWTQSTTGSVPGCMRGASRSARMASACLPTAISPASIP